MTIDDPLSKIRDIAKDGEFDFFGATLQIGGMASPIFKIASIVKGILDSQLNGNTWKTAVIALCDELQRLHSKLPFDFDSAIESVWFRRVVVVLMDESARSADVEFARLLGRIAANGCLSQGEAAHRKDDLASYIRDLARLGADDVRFLKLLKTCFGKVNIGNHDGYAAYYDGYKEKAQEAGFQEDDRVALGARLSGFGLVYEPPTQPFPGSHFVRPTKRGLYLLSLLEAAELPVAEQN